MIDNMDRIPVFIAAGSVSIRELAAIFSCADLVVSNSTGPLHLAVALGVPTVSVYSPIRRAIRRAGALIPPIRRERGIIMVLVAPMIGDEKTMVSEDMSAVSVEEVLAGMPALSLDEDRPL